MGSRITYSGLGASLAIGIDPDVFREEDVLLVEVLVLLEGRSPRNLFRSLDSRVQTLVNDPGQSAQELTIESIANSMLERG